MNKENYAFDEKAIINAMKKAFVNPVDNQMLEDAPAMKANAKEEPEKPKRAYKLSPERKICAMAKRSFNYLPQPLKDAHNKKLCVDAVLAAHPNLCPDPLRFWGWLSDEANILATRTWDFAEVCKKFKLDSIAVAQHLVLEGKTVTNKIRMEGLASYGGNIRLFSERLINDKDLPKLEQLLVQGHEQVDRKEA